jgi:hypothetical protein
MHAGRFAAAVFFTVEAFALYETDPKALYEQLAQLAGRSA